MYDIAIVGTGPAGTTLARLIGKQYRVLLIDKRKLSPLSDAEPASKCCGGLLAPDAQKMLAKMGLCLTHHVLAGPQLFAVRTIDMLNGLERYYQRSYLNIDRGRFDQWLLSLVPDCVDVRPGCTFHSFEQKKDGIAIQLDQDGKIFHEQAKVLVAADGAFSLVRRNKFFDGPAPRTYVAIQEWFAADKALPYFTAVFDPEITDFYSWIIPKNDALIIGSALEPGDAAIKKFEHFKKKLRQYGFEWGPRMERKGATLLRPVKASQICVGRGNIALVGEAAGWISPSSAEGISYAFRSAAALAEALRQGLSDFLVRYAANTRRLRTNIFLKNLKSPFMYNPLLRKIVMKSGIKAI